MITHDSKSNLPLTAVICANSVIIRPFQDFYGQNEMLKLLLYLVNRALHGNNNIKVQN